MVFLELDEARKHPDSPRHRRHIPRHRWHIPKQPKVPKILSETTKNAKQTWSCSKSCKMSHFVSFYIIFYMFLHLCFSNYSNTLSTNVGIDMTTNVGIHTTNVGINMTTNVGIHVTTGLIYTDLRKSG